MKYVGIANNLSKNNAVEFSRLHKSQKKLIKQFYKSQRYSASYKGLDTVFIAKHEQQIIGSLIVSQIEPENGQYLLHGFIIDKNYRNMGVAASLHQFAVTSLVEEHTREKQHSIHEITCFADKSLADFYHKLGYNTQAQGHLNDTLLPRFIAYQKHQNELVIFSKTML